MPRSITKAVTVYFGDQQVFSRECTAFQCEETLAGTFTASAEFAPPRVDWTAGD